MIVQFKLENNDYIELNSLLKVAGLCESGGRANQLIVSGNVLVNGKTETRKRCKIRHGQQVEFDGQRIQVE
ncbi:MAG: RNA-binding S4 domain-containing protein [Gammaproteobacteria bacterium]|nr:RNA-binding S4 domain-containing protein [Gammaproteobacteria bacterium]